MNPILKIKEWRGRQFTQVSPRVIHLHKCDRYVTIGAIYHCGYEREDAVKFKGGLSDGISIVFDFISSNTCTTEGIIEADKICYNVEEGFFF